MREKLIELIREAKFDVDRICVERDWCDGCPAAYGEGNCKEAYIADHLIANGVTIPKYGEWTGTYLRNIGFWAYKCSECEEFSDYDSDYCPHCGAKMSRKDSDNK